ncbi:MAG: DUF1192 domain-containing protein [Pseudomonadota bacterium]
MDDDLDLTKSDLLLAHLAKEDLTTLSVDDLEVRISHLKADIARCRGLIGQRQASKSAAETFFKS